MIALLDVNLLVALFDPVHVHHDTAHAWFAREREHGWASCPITENGFVRVISNPAFPGSRTTVEDALSRLLTFKCGGNYTFWPDILSLCDMADLEPRSIRGHLQITDVYLLALAVANEGRLATLDARIGVAAVKSAQSAHLTVIRS